MRVKSCRTGSSGGRRLTPGLALSDAAAATAAPTPRRPSSLPPGYRYCSNNPDPKHNTCDAPQELSDAEIDRLHAENVGAAPGRRQPPPALAAAPAPAPLLLVWSLHAHLNECNNFKRFPRPAGQGRGGGRGRGGQRRGSGRSGGRRRPAAAPPPARVAAGHLQPLYTSGAQGAG